jgi:AraC-like DNA-binding protein
VVAVPALFDFRTRRPGPPLERYVESVWYARGTVPYARERIAPTGSTVAIIVLGDPLRMVPDDGAGKPVVAEDGVIIGPHDRPLINEPLGETFALGVVTTSVGCASTIGLEPRRLRGRTAPLASWTAGSRLRSELASASDPEAMLETVERGLRASLRTDVAGVDRCARAVSLLEADPLRPVAAIAAEVGVSHAHLDREFTRVVGLTPRVLSRLLRMRRLLRGIDVRGEVAWADLSAELGWYDQAHLIRDFKRHTGVVPSAYLHAQRTSDSVVQAGDAAGFVPEG